MLKPYNNDLGHGLFYLSDIEQTQRNQMVDLEDTLSQMMAERDSLLHEVLLFKTLNQDSQKKAAILKEEVDTLKSKLEHQQMAGAGSCLDIQKYKNDVSAQTLKFRKVLDELQSKNDALAQKVTDFGSHVIKMEAAKGEDVQKMKKVYEDKITMLNYEHRCVVAEIIKKQALKTKGYEAAVNQLREQVIMKDSEVKMCHVMMKDMKCHMEKEVSLVKSEMEAAAQKSEAQLREKLMEMEKSVAKLSRWNHRLIKEYENKLRCIRKENEIQLYAGASVADSHV